MWKNLFEWRFGSGIKYGLKKCFGWKKKQKNNLVSFAFFPVQFGSLLHPPHPNFYLLFFFCAMLLTHNTHRTEHEKRKETASIRNTEEREREQQVIICPRDNNLGGCFLKVYFYFLFWNDSAILDELDVTLGRRRGSSTPAPTGFFFFIGAKNNSLNSNVGFFFLKSPLFLNIFKIKKCYVKVELDGGILRIQ